MCKNEFPCHKEVPTAVCTLDTYFGQIDWYTAHFYFHTVHLSSIFTTNDVSGTARQINQLM